MNLIPVCKFEFVSCGLVKKKIIGAKENNLVQDKYCMTNIKSARKQYLASKPSTIAFYYFNLHIIFLYYLSMLVRAKPHA